MKNITYILFLPILIAGMFVSINVLNADFYGRLTGTVPFKTYYSAKKEANNLPKVMLVVHRYLSDENAMEASLIMSYDRHSLFDSINVRKAKLALTIMDGYSYEPVGLRKSFVYLDSVDRKTYGFVYSVYETERFILPVAPSVYGFPFDDIKIRPIIQFYVNDESFSYNFSIQKRLPGRVFALDEKEIIIGFTRLSSEKYFVIISSGLFLLLTILLTYSLIAHKAGLSNVEELVAVAGYILATAGFREIVGIARNSGTSALEILIILIPLLSVTMALFFSFARSFVTKK